ncbi:MAG: translesion error-prone DNA polymerase V autoproteolytic subunit [Bacteroidetes bacterium]|nr:translesion error-prone DNA polymerase V autoproteolytic subunit [Bacteroidota bacterium]
MAAPPSGSSVVAGAPSRVAAVFTAWKRVSCARPLFLTRVPAGFPSPADDYVDRTLDLNDLLIRRPEATFFVRVEGDSMTGAGIHSGDLLVVDRSVEARDGDVVIAALDGEMTVKRVRQREEALWLVADNDAYPPQRVTTELVVWGVVQHVIHEVE